MIWSEFRAEPAAFWHGDQVWDKPIAFVDLDREDAVEELVRPPCPLIGIGDCASPLAPFVDAIADEFVGPNTLVEQVLQAPRAASALVQLLRMLPSLRIDDALNAESFAYAMLQGSDEHRRWLAQNKSLNQEPGAVDVTRDGDDLTITLDRVHAGNAIDRIMRDGLYDAFALASLDENVTRVILRADGKAFSVGADLAEFGTIQNPATAHTIRAFTLPARMALRCAGKMEAHIHGACVGAGLEIVAFASRITATSQAWFQLPELKMGILPGAGGCVSLTRRIGRQRAGLLMLSGKRLSAKRALEWGLIDAIVDDLS